MQPAPRQVFLAEGSGVLDHGERVPGTLNISRNHFAPEAADAIHRQVMRFTRYRRTDQSVAEYIVELHLLRWRAESKMEMGAGFPDQFISIACMDNALLSRCEQSLDTASCRNSLRFEGASATMRGLFGSRGGGSRKDALITEDAMKSHASDEGLGVLAAYRKAKNKGRERKRRSAPPNAGGVR